MRLISISVRDSTTSSIRSGWMMATMYFIWHALLVSRSLLTFGLLEVRRRRVCGHTHLRYVESDHLLVSGHADTLHALLDTEEDVHQAEGPDEDHYRVYC